MSDGGVGDQVEERINRLRRMAEQIAERLGGHPGVVRLQAVMDTYDRSGGGLVAGGLAYTSLLALLPGLLLILSVVGFVVRDPGVQERIVAAVAQTLPPLEDVAKLALAGVSTNAVPNGIFALVTLLWGSSRFYANLDTAFSRIFVGAPRRNPVVQTVRGIVLTIVLILLPVALVTVGSIFSWLEHFAPDGIDVGAGLAFVLDLASPLGLLAAFGLAVALCYRYVPSEHVPWRALIVPAAAIGLVLAVFTQIYVFIAPRLMGLWAVYGTALAVFGLLAWLSIAFNVLLVGAAWTEVRSRMGPFIDVGLGGRAGERAGQDLSAQPADEPAPDA
jgi:YihY family inner membrane protein